MYAAVVGPAIGESLAALSYFQHRAPTRRAIPTNRLARLYAASQRKPCPELFHLLHFNCGFAISALNETLSESTLVDARQDNNNCLILWMLQQLGNPSMQHYAMVLKQLLGVSQCLVGLPVPWEPSGRGRRAGCGGGTGGRTTAKGGGSRRGVGNSASPRPSNSQGIHRKSSCNDGYMHFPFVCFVDHRAKDDVGSRVGEPCDHF
mmetsp:Transcript_33580/g.73287  ORF Transcript_33580/g.73287 Transcript_33580/m.73287 type:complete len:205 (+) Transcript_33580:151-765(+)